MNWFTKLLPTRIRTEGGTRKSVPEGLWRKCDVCSAVLYRADLERNLDVCPKCDHHMRIGARQRLNDFLDPEVRSEIADNLKPVDALKFRDLKKYKDRITQAQKATEENDALVVVKGEVKGTPLVAAAFEFKFTPATRTGIPRLSQTKIVGGIHLEIPARDHARKMVVGLVCPDHGPLHHLYPVIEQ